MLKSLFLLFLVVSSSANVFSQDTIVSNNNAIEKINQKDDLGRKQGLWVVYGKNKPEKGFPENGKVEEGHYLDNRKHGEWIKYHSDGKTPRLVGDFHHGRPKGDYKKLYNNGRVLEEGVFKDKVQTGEYKKYYQSGKVEQVRIFNTAGLEDGIQKYYYPNGQIQYQFSKENGVNAGIATRYTEDGQVKEVITYGEDGSINSFEEKEIKDDTPLVEAGDGGPDGAHGNTRGMTFNKNGYNKVYNSDDELWIDGEFKNSKLWHGKLYKYDADGILLKAEIWQNGKYHSDTVL